MTSRLAPRRLRTLAALLVIGAASVPGIAGAQDVPEVNDPTGPSGSFCSSIPPDGEGSFAGMADDLVATAASNNPYLTTLVSAVQAAGLVDTLNGEGPFTVFAPNNEAFAKIPPAELDAILADTQLLTQILLMHVVVGTSFSSAELLEVGSVETAQGSDLVFTAEADGDITINGGAASVTCADVTTANATVHVIDTVLTPPALVQVH